jgi:hypothetical protein
VDGKPNRGALWPRQGACRLCGEVRALCRSHIIPKFVGDWMRDTGGGGRLRTSDAPDRLVEDLPTRHMLCLECEARFNRFETEVCNRLFLPLHSREHDRFRYGPSFTLFAVSVVWRALILLRTERRLQQALEDEPGAIEAAEEAWRSFLLGERRAPAPHAVHTLPMDIPIELDTSGLSPYWARFVCGFPASEVGTGTAVATCW